MDYIITAIVSSFSSVGLIGLVAYCFRAWILNKLRWSTKHDYDKKMLEVETQKDIRLKSELVAELLAEWIRKDGKLEYYQLNKLTFQAFLWLPKELAEDLSNCLSHKEEAKDVRTIIIDIRTHLNGASDGLQPNDVIIFSGQQPSNETQMP